MCTWGYFPYSNHECVYGEYNIWGMSQSVWQAHKESVYDTQEPWGPSASGSHLLWDAKESSLQGTHVFIVPGVVRTAVFSFVKTRFLLYFLLLFYPPQPLWGFAQAVALWVLLPLLGCLLSKLGTWGTETETKASFHGELGGTAQPPLWQPRSGEKGRDQGPGITFKGIAPSDVPRWRHLGTVAGSVIISFISCLLLFTRCYIIKPHHQNKSKNKSHIHFTYLVHLCTCVAGRGCGKCIPFLLYTSGIVSNLTDCHTILFIISYQFHPARRQNK